MNRKIQIPLYWLIVIALLGCCMELDISIPSFPQIKYYFKVTEPLVQATLSANFAGFCLAGLLYGPLSEVFGRRKGMVIGATFFFGGALGCVIAPSISFLIFSRFIQGIGASSACVLGFTMLADVYHGEEAMKYIGRVNGLATALMAFAPVIGGVLTQYGNWRINFFVIAILGFIAWILQLRYLPETKRELAPFSRKVIIGDYITLLKSSRFIMYAMIPNLLCVAYLTFIGSTAFYYQETCGFSVLNFALNEGAVVVCFSFMSFYAGNVIEVFGSRKSTLIGMTIAALSALLLGLIAVYFPFKAYWVTASMSLFAIGSAFAFSVTFTESLEVFPDLKGTASSLIMSSRLLFSAIAVGISGQYFDGTMTPVAMITMVSVFVSALLAFRVYKK